MTALELVKSDNPRVAVTVKMVRDQLRDYPKYNEIVKYELTDDEIADNIINAIAEFNAASPYMSNFDPKNFPDRKLLLDMSIVECLEILYTWHARNQFSASDAGLQIPIHEQWEPLMRISETMRLRTDRRVKELKTQLNIRNGWGDGVGSPIGWWGL